MGYPKDPTKDSTTVLVHCPKKVKAKLKYLKALATEKFKLSDGLLKTIQLGLSKRGRKKLFVKVDHDPVSPEPIVIPKEVHAKIVDLQDRFKVGSKQDVIIQLLTIGIEFFEAA